MDKPLDEINEGDLLNLKNNKVTEGRTIEYKIILPTNTHDSKKEFLADVSSFANATGGDLIFGVKEKDSIPIEIPGIANVNVDQQILRLENSLRDNIKPRLHGYRIKIIHLSSGAVVILLRIPSSWSKPHVVDFERHWRFYSHNSRGKYELDVGEVRSAFIEASGLVDKIRSFRDMRIGSIVADDGPIPLLSGSRVILHLIPFISFDQSIRFPLDEIANNPRTLSPIFSITTGQRYNFDGYVTYGGIGGNQAHGYVQIFRNGIIEAVDAGLLMTRGSGTHIPIKYFENKLVLSLSMYLSNQKKMTIPTPISLLLTLVGVRGYYLGVPEELRDANDNATVIDKDTLLLPEVVIWDYDNDPKELLHSIFDTIWNSAGWPQSPNYDVS